MQALLASIVTHSEDAIYSKTFAGYITSWNAGAEKMYGYTPEEAIGKHVSFLAPVEYANEIESILVKIRLVNRLRIIETTRVRKNGEHITVSLSVLPIRNVNGDLIGASTIVRDITGRKQAENALAMANKKLNILNSITRHDILNQLPRDPGIPRTLSRGVPRRHESPGIFQSAHRNCKSYREPDLVYQILPGSWGSGSCLAAGAGDRRGSCRNGSVWRYPVYH